MYWFTMMCVFIFLCEHFVCEECSGYVYMCYFPVGILFDMYFYFILNIIIIFYQYLNIFFTLLLIYDWSFVFKYIFLT